MDTGDVMEFVDVGGAVSSSRRYYAKIYMEQDAE